ncbi:EVI2B protein, partial [Odontophorus gujanensis]|nr:EVI2B protein [Odontophorus gujanensis]
MVSNAVTLVLFCGEIWKSLSTEIPSNVSTSESSVQTSTRSPTEDRPTTHQPQTTSPSMQEPAGALTAGTTLPQLPETHIEPTNGSWAAALIMGIVLVSMVITISMIVLRKCCKRPLLADSNWAGQSPFADGDTPDVFMDSGQATKRSSILFTLPWKLREEAIIQHDPPTSEKPPNGTASTEQPPAAHSCSTTSTAAAMAPGPEVGSPEQEQCPQPAECPELPPPPAWLTQPAQEHTSHPSQQEELHSEEKEPYPPPLELITDEIHGSLPQPEHPQ